MIIAVNGKTKPEEMRHELDIALNLSLSVVRLDGPCEVNGRIIGPITAVSKESTDHRHTL